MRLICLFVVVVVCLFMLSSYQLTNNPSFLCSSFSLQDKCIDFVTTSSRTGTKSVRDLFKFAAQMTVMTAEKRRNVLVTNDAKNQVGEGGKMMKNGGKIYEDDEAPAPQSHVNDRAAYIRRNGDAFGNLYTTME